MFSGFLKQILITAGADFIGYHLVDSLIENENYKVTRFDKLEEKLLGKTGKQLTYLHKKAL